MVNLLPIIVKGLSPSLVSKHEIIFLRMSDLLTQNVHLVQNDLPTYTVSTRKFDLKVTVSDFGD